jgi:hypothetical protein
VDRQYAALLIGHHESTTELKELLESRVDAIPSDVTKEALTELLELGISDERLVPLLRTYDLHLGSPLRACALRCAPPSLLSRLGDLTEDELTSLVERFAKVEMTYSEGTWLVNRARSLEQRKTLLAGHPELVSALMGADCSRDDLEPLLEVPGVQEAWESSALSALGRGAPDWASLAFDRLELPWAALHADLFAEVAQQLLGALGDDLQAWDTAISLLGSWEGTLADLVETCTGV